MYLLEWNLGSIVLSSWQDVIHHPMYPQATVYEWIGGLGWCE
jgi:hypothetical protein